MTSEQLGGMALPETVVPGWLTFFGRALLDRLGPDLETRIGAASLHHLAERRIRAAEAPFVGLLSRPSDLGALPDASACTFGLVAE